jgi:hypothetical protein
MFNVVPKEIVMSDYTFIFQAQADGSVAFYSQKEQEAPTSPPANVAVSLTEGDTVGFLLLPVVGSSQGMESIQLVFTPSGGGVRKDELMMPFFVAPTPAGKPTPTDTYTWKTGDSDAVLVQTKSNWTFVGTLTASDKSTYALTDPELQVGDGT